MSRAEILKNLIKVRDEIQEEARRLLLEANKEDVGPTWEAAHDLSLGLWDVWKSVDEAAEALRALEHGATP